MRSDMKYVLIERPRAGGWAETRKTGGKIRVEDLDDENDTIRPDASVKRLPTSRLRVYGHAAKELTDLIGPLRRWVEAQVGRRWDEVYSEACQTLDRRSTMGNHVFEHLLRMVTTNTVLVDGKVMTFLNGGGELREIDYYDFLYVHPKTGILHKAAGKRPRYNWAASTKHKDILDGPTDLTRFTREDGIWYLSTYERHLKPPPLFNYGKDRLLRDLIEKFEAEWDERIEIKDRVFYVRRHTKVAYLRRVSKRQLSTKELQKQGLVNETNDRPMRRRKLRN